MKIEVQTTTTHIYNIVLNDKEYWLVMSALIEYANLARHKGMNEESDIKRIAEILRECRVTN